MKDNIDTVLTRINI